MSVAFHACITRGRHDITTVPYKRAVVDHAYGVELVSKNMEGNSAPIASVDGQILILCFSNIAYAHLTRAPAGGAFNCSIQRLWLTESGRKRASS